MNLNDSARVCAEGMIAEAERFRVAVRQCAAGRGLSIAVCTCRAASRPGDGWPRCAWPGGQTSKSCAPPLELGDCRESWSVRTTPSRPVWLRNMRDGASHWRATSPWGLARCECARKEPLFDKIDYREDGSTAVGVLETAQLPTPAVCSYLAEECGIAPSGLTLLVARTASQAGGVQIVARSVETAMHKLMESGFDLRRVESGFGVAPLPPVAKDDLSAIGRTNDAILYGGEVTLWVRGDDDSLAQIGPGLPSAASPDHDAMFAELFRRCGGDFYKMDPQLFSPAVITLSNLDTGRSHRFGRLMPELLERSFGT